MLLKLYIPKTQGHSEANVIADETKNKWSRREQSSIWKKNISFKYNNFHREYSFFFFFLKVLPYTYTYDLYAIYYLLSGHKYLKKKDYE